MYFTVLVLTDLPSAVGSMPPCGVRGSNSAKDMDMCDVFY